MRHPIIGQYSDVQLRFKRSTDTSNLVRQGPVFAWHQRAMAQVMNMVLSFVRGVVR